MNNTSSANSLLPTIIVVGILILIIAFCVKMIKVTSKAKKERKEKMKTLKNSGLLQYTAFSHVNGLPIPENTFVEVFSYPDRLEFKAGTTNINLQRDKISDMCIKTDTEIQNQAVSSAGGAVAGALMFGALGAAIGGRTKTKKVKTVTSYLIITYTNNQGELSFIGFDIKNNPPAAAKLVKEFRERNTTSGVEISL